MLNKVILIGRLCSDPEVRATPQGRHVTSLRLATNTYAGRDEQGHRQQHSDFHTVVLFGRLAEIAGGYLRKGKLIYTEGRLQQRSWEGRGGHRRNAAEIIADTLQILGGGQQAPGAEEVA